MFYYVLRIRSNEKLKFNVDNLILVQWQCLVLITCVQPVMVYLSERSRQTHSRGSSELFELHHLVVRATRADSICAQTILLDSRVHL